MSFPRKEISLSANGLIERATGLTPLQVLHQLMTRNNTGLWAQQGADNLIADVWLEFADLVAGEPFEGNVANPGFAQTFRPIVQLAQVWHLLVIRREDQFAGLSVPDSVLSTPLVQQVASADAERRLERSGWVVDARMDDLAVA